MEPLVQGRSQQTAKTAPPVSAMSSSSSLLDSDRQHRLVVAAAARYDHHPDLVVPVDNAAAAVDSRNNNVGHAQAVFNSKRRDAARRESNLNHRSHSGHRSNHHHHHHHQQSAVAEQHQPTHQRSSYQALQQHQHQRDYPINHHQQQLQQQQQFRPAPTPHPPQHVKYCQHHSRQASYSSSSGASSSSSSSTTSSHGRPSSSMSGMTASNSRHEVAGNDDFGLKQEARESVSPMRGELTRINEAKTSRDVQQNYERSNRVKKMERGISKASENELIVDQVRHHVETHFQGGRGSPDSPDSVGFVSGVGPGAVLAAAAASPSGFVDTPVYTFTLPDLTGYPEDYRNFLERDLIELSSLVSLEGSGRLNWWAETGACQRLWPLATTGDGNCLLHAASLGMWGFHDRLLTLRKALHHFLSSSAAAAPIYRRWRYQSHLQNMQYGLVLSEREWTEEWKSVLRLASSEPRHGSSSSSSTASSSEGGNASSASSMSCGTGGAKAATRRLSRLSIAMGDSLGDGSPQQQPPQQPLYESLEEVHVLALAHVLRRPIIVVADTVLKDLNGDALAPINFGGVYLPLECPPDECHRSPLLLTYNAGHFSALVSMERPRRGHRGSRGSIDGSEESSSPWVPAVIPLTDSEHAALPLHFAVDPGAEFCWNRDEFDMEVARDLALSPQDQYNLLNSYLEIVKVALPDWFLEGSPSPDPTEMPTSSVPTSTTVTHNQLPKAGTVTILPGHKPSVAKQFGSIGKKLKKNLGKLTRTSSFKKAPRGGTQEELDGDMALALRQSLDNYNQQQQQQQRRIVGTAQPYILSAFIHASVQRPPPFQSEMVENYLHEARRRYETDREKKRKQREEREEAEEARKREIYLNGGFRDCATQGCRGRAASAASEEGDGDACFLCKLCLAQKQQQQQQQPQRPRSAVSCHGNSRFYTSSSDENDAADGRAPSRSDWVQSGGDPSSTLAAGLRVKLPPPSASDAIKSSPSTAGSSSGGQWSAASPVSSPRPCRGEGCDFFGTVEMKGYCSKCFLKMRER